MDVQLPQVQPMTPAAQAPASTGSSVAAAAKGLGAIAIVSVPLVAFSDDIVAGGKKLKGAVKGAWDYMFGGKKKSKKDGDDDESYDSPVTNAMTHMVESGEEFLSEFTKENDALEKGVKKLGEVQEGINEQVNRRTALQKQFGEMQANPTALPAPNSVALAAPKDDGEEQSTATTSEKTEAIANA